MIRFHVYSNSPSLSRRLFPLFSMAFARSKQSRSNRPPHHSFPPLRFCVHIHFYLGTIQAKFVDRVKIWITFIFSPTHRFASHGFHLLRAASHPFSILHSFLTSRRSVILTCHEHGRSVELTQCLTDHALDHTSSRYTSPVSLEQVRL